MIIVLGDPRRSQRELQKRVGMKKVFMKEVISELGLQGLAIN